MDTLLLDPVHRTFRTLFGRRDALKSDLISLYRTYRNQQAFEFFEAGQLTEYEYFRLFYDQHTPESVRKILPRPQKLKKILLKEVSWMPGALALLEETHGSGISTGIASNYSLWYHSILRSCPQIAELCDYLFFSCEIGYRKPDARFYLEIGEALSREGIAQVFFLDDRPGNVQAARDCGWEAHTFTGMAEARPLIADFLRE